MNENNTEALEVTEETSTVEETPEESSGMETESSVEEEEIGSGSSASSGETVVVQTIDTSTLELYTSQIQETVSHPFLTTPFADYTVTEGLLLLSFLFCFLSFFLNLGRR